MRSLTHRTVRFTGSVSHERSSRGPARLSVAAAVVAVAVAGCSSGTADTVAAPGPPAGVARLCRALHSALPRTVAGQARHRVAPASDLTAAWGDPSIVLRCGVARPDVLTPGSPHYDPTADAVGVDGVDWLPQKQSNGSVRCTTTLRKAYVEVTIPRTYAGPYGDVSPLADLAAAVRRTDPTGL